jgi:ABC-2 type transport system ATP-binding protein
MFEADALCDRIAVISKGEIVAEGTPADLKRGVDQGSVLEVEVYGVEEKTIERLRRVPGVLAVAVEEREQTQVLVVQTQTEAELTSSILGHLNGGQVGRISQREPTLEDAYVALVTEE